MLHLVKSVLYILPVNYESPFLPRKKIKPRHKRLKLRY